MKLISNNGVRIGEPISGGRVRVYNGVISERLFPIFTVDAPCRVDFVVRVRAVPAGESDEGVCELLGGLYAKEIQPEMAYGDIVERSCMKAASAYQRRILGLGNEDVPALHQREFYAALEACRK